MVIISGVPIFRIFTVNHINLQMHGYTLVLRRETTFVTLYLVPKETYSPCKMRSTFKQKNLLQVVQILSFPKLKFSKGWQNILIAGVTIFIRL